MSAVTSQQANLERVEPQLRELLGLAGLASSLPPWSRGLRASQSGQYLSKVRGRGMEYDESRPYQPGDDVRQLDWRVTARTGRPHTKLFREERERPVFVAVDYSPSMFFATQGVFKAVQAARLASLLAWRAQTNGDRVGGVVFTPKFHHELVPRRGKEAVIRLLKLLANDAGMTRQETPSSERSTALTDSLTRLRRLAKPGSLVFLLSDFAGFDDHAASELARLAAHTDVAMLQVYDVLEANFPALEVGGTLRDGRDSLRLTSVSERQQQNYASRFDAETARLKQAAREQRALFTQVDTTSEPLAALFKLLTA